jgi:hypothetical protein
MQGRRIPLHHSLQQDAFLEYLGYASMTTMWDKNGHNGTKVPGLTFGSEGGHLRAYTRITWLLVRTEEKI